jgi:hypothetical protein
MRDAIFKAQKEVRQRTKGMTIDEKEEVYRAFNHEYNRMIAEIQQFEHDGAYELMISQYHLKKSKFRLLKDLPGQGYRC